MTSTQLQSLETRLDALQEAHKTTLQLINRLINIKIQPGSFSLDSEDANARTELTAEIHENIKNEDEDLELLKQEIDDLLETAGRQDQGRAQDQARLNVQAARIAEDFKLARARFRSAQVQSKRNDALARSKERDLLFSSNEADDKVVRRRTEKKGGQDEAVAASGDVTAALRRTQQLLQTELQRSHFAQEIFNQSSEAIKQLSVSYNDLDTLLASSKSLLTTLVKSNKSDTWYLETTVYLLVATIAWLFFRRFLYGPTWWLVYLPIKLAFRTIYTVFGLAGYTLSSTNKTLSNTTTAISPLSISSSLLNPMSTSTSKSCNGGGQKDQSASSDDKHPLSAEIAQQIEENQEKNARVVRGDGTVLEHSDAPRNPKKRVFEVKDGAGDGQEETKTKDEL